MRLDDLDDGNLDDNVNAEYQRGGGGGFGFPGSGGGGMSLGRGGMGCGTILLLVAVAYFSGGNLSDMMGGQMSPTQQVQAPAASGDGSSCNTNAATNFSCKVLVSNNLTWAKLFTDGGYKKPGIVFYDGQGQSGCGAAQSAMGPFYCPADQKIYLDTTFYDELKTRFGAAGDFAQAYVIAHEAGHHIQYLTGVADKVRQAQSRASRTEGNRYQVAMELQADCYAGVWAAQNKDRMDPGDVEEGLTAAHAIGDDVLQRQSQGVVVESSFTHGSAEQRMSWLKRGLQTGDPEQCNTFK